MSIDIDALIKKANDEVAPPETVDLPLLVGGEVLKFRFEQLNPMGWRNVVAKTTFRADVGADLVAGGNTDLMARGYPIAHIKVVDDDGLVDVSLAQWHAIFDQLIPDDIAILGMTLWGLNVQKSAQLKADALVRAEKKASPRVKKK